MKRFLGILLFFFALVVVKSHSLFVVKGPYFGPGRVCVEFFFVLSGYLFLSFLEKSKERSISENISALLKSKVKPLAIPLCIGLLSNIIYAIVSKEFKTWGYLWYIEVMIVEMILLVLLRKWIKSDKKFYISLAVIAIAALIIKFSGLCYSWGYIRGAASIPIGILIALIPKINLKRKWITLVSLIPIIAACFYIVFYQLGNFELGGVRVIEILLDVILYPALIYLSFCLDFKCKFFNYLGALSFGLYAFQCPADLFRLLGATNLWFLFGFILIATLLEDGGKRIYKHYRNKKAI